MISSKSISVNIRLRNSNSSNPAWTVKSGSIFQKIDKDSQLVYDCYQNVFLEETNDEIYKLSVQDAILQAWQGTNLTIFAYGQTGTGKTHTMMGTDTESGIIQSSLTDIFELSSVESKKNRTVVEVAYIEIYNESITDLITPNNKVKIFGSGDNTIISNLSKIRVRSKADVLEIIRDCETKRRYGVTEYNSRSSRSHTIFQLHLTKNSRKTLVNMIDLAGSERASSNYERRKEGAYINRSLLALGSVISALVKNEHVNYRDSKLTRLLQSSLTGRCSVISLCMISVERDCLLESTTTLKFAARLSQVELKQRSERIVVESSSNSCVMCQNCKSRENELKIQVSDADSDNAQNSNPGDSRDNNTMKSNLDSVTGIESEKEKSNIDNESVSTNLIEPDSKQINFNEEGVNPISTQEEPGKDDKIEIDVVKQDNMNDIHDVNDINSNPECKDELVISGESVNKTFKNSFVASACEKTENNISRSISNDQVHEKNQDNNQQMCDILSDIKITPTFCKEPKECAGIHVNSVSDDQSVSSSTNTSDSNNDATITVTASCLRCHCCSQTNSQDSTNKNTNNKHAMPSIDFNDIVKGERFIADIKQAESLKSENTYLLAENKLLVERIKNLEETVANLMAQNPSKRINDLYILEKNMFNLQLEMLKRRIN